MLLAPGGVVVRVSAGGRSRYYSEQLLVCYSVH